MSKFIAMFYLKPNLKEKKINSLEKTITNFFEKNTKVKKVWYLGKKNLNSKEHKNIEGIYIKILLSANIKKIENIKKELSRNKNILSFAIILDKNTTLPILKKTKSIFKPSPKKTKISINKKDKKVYMLINKNLKLPFAETQIMFISEDINKLLKLAAGKINDYIYIKGYRTIKQFKNINDVNNELKRTWHVKFALEDNYNVMQELTICERNLI